MIMIAYLAREFLYVVLQAALFWKRPAGTRILMYHSVGGSGPLSVSAPDFERQMAYLARHFEVVPLAAARAPKEYARTARPRACITFDDGFEDLYLHALPILSAYSFPATFFITVGYIGGMHPVFYGSESCMSAGQIRDLHARGYAIGAHTLTHPKLTGLPIASVRAEVAGSKAALEAIIHAPVTAFAYPKGRYNALVRDEVARAGFVTAVTVREGACSEAVDPLLMPRVAVDPSMGYFHFTGKLSAALPVYTKLMDILCRK